VNTQFASEIRATLLAVRRPHSASSRQPLTASLYRALVIPQAPDCTDERVDIFSWNLGGTEENVFWDSA